MNQAAPRHGAGLMGLWLLVAFFAFTVLVPGQPAGAAAPKYTVIDCPKNQGVLGFPAWFEGLKCTTSDQDSLSTPKMDSLNGVWVIVMNVVQWMILATAYVSLYFIIYSGFKYITATGEPGNIKTAQDTLRYAITGLVIAIISVAIVRTIQAAVSGNIV